MSIWLIIGIIVLVIILLRIGLLGFIFEIIGSSLGGDDGDSSSGGGFGGGDSGGGGSSSDW
jgi:uncharacterized membrane protein YgcG